MQIDPKRVLVVGCSFTSGYYYKIPVDPKHPWKAPEEVDHTYGWYDELPKQHSYDVYAHPGGGYLQYVMLLTNKININDYDMVLIQETFEPRLSIDTEINYTPRRNDGRIRVRGLATDTRVYTLNWRSNRTDWISHITYRNYNEYGLEKNQGLDNWLTAMSYSPAQKVIHAATVELMNSICKEAGIPAYAYGLSGNRYKHSYIKYISTPDILEELFYKDEFHNVVNDQPYHFTKEGTRILGKWIKNGLEGIL